ASQIHRQMREAIPDCIIKSVAPVNKAGCFGTQGADIHAMSVLRAERRGEKNYSNFPINEMNTEMQEFANSKKNPTFRLPLTMEILDEMKDNIILSRPRFQKRFGHLLSSLGKA